MPKIFEKLDKVEPVYDIAYKVTLFVCKLLLVADIIITCYSVLMRYISLIPKQTWAQGTFLMALEGLPLPLWAEEMILTLMAYMVVLSAALAIPRNAHIRMSAFDNYLPKKVLNVLDLLADLCVILLAVVMIVVGWQYATTIGSKGTYATMTWLSRFWKYFPVPVAGVAMLIFELEATYEHVKAFWVKEEKK